MASAAPQVHEQTEHDQVVDWRLGELLAAGYKQEDALELALALRIDLHLAVELPRRGCPHETAVRILY
jgi:hypothetical protein